MISTPIFNVQSKFHDAWVKHVTSKAFIWSYYTYIRITFPPHVDHAFIVPEPYLTRRRNHKNKCSENNSYILHKHMRLLNCSQAFHFI